MPGELSEECKQKLRDLDHNLEGAYSAVQATDHYSAFHSSAAITEQINALGEVDQSCAQVLREIDRTVGSLSLVSRIQAITPSYRFGETDQLLRDIETAIGIVRHYLTLG